MIKTKPPTSTKDHLKRFLEKNKTLMKVVDSQQNNDGNKNKQIKKKTVSAKCSFIQCSPLIDKQKSQRVNENKLYKRILLTEDSYNSNILEKNSSFPQKIRFNQSTIIYKEQKSDTKHIPSMFKTLRTSSINLNTTNNSRYSSKIEEQSDNNKNNCSKKNNTSLSDRLDFTTPLQIWRQVNKQYKKNKNYYNNNNNHNTTITGDFITQTKNNKNYSINRAKAFIQREINGLKQKCYIKKKQQSTQQQQQMINNNNTAEQLLQKYLFKQSQDKIKKDNNKKRQNQEDQLENKILLRRSLSCDEFEKSKIKCDNMFCYKGKQDNPNHNHKTYTQSPSNNESQQQHKYKFQLLKSPKRTNPIVLLHKQPLDTCIQRYFNPLIRRVQKQKQQNKLLSSVISKQIFMRIKAKKLTQRNVDKLERIKNDLFKQLSRTTGMMGETLTTTLKTTLTTTLKTTTTDNHLQIDRRNKLQQHQQHHHNNKHMSWTTFKKATNNKRLSNKNLLLMNTSVSTQQQQRLSKRRRASNKQNNFNNNKQRQFDKRLLQAELVQLDALHRQQQHNKENTYIKDDNNLSQNRLNILNRPQLIHLKIPSIINNNNSNSNSHQQQQLTNNNNNNINSNIIHTPTITTLRSSMISFGDCQPNYDDQQHNNNNKCKKQKKNGSFFNAW